MILLSPPTPIKLAHQYQQTKKRSLVLNPISSSEPDLICGEAVQSNEEPLISALISVPEPLLGSDAIITADTGVEGGEASHTPVSGNSYLKAGIRNRCVFKNQHFYCHGDHRSGRRRYQTKFGKCSEAKPTKGSRKGVEDVEQRPGWLPDSWTVTCETRNSCAPAGGGITDRVKIG